MEYKLSAVLYGHTLDVRALAVTHDGYILSASRDRTTKIWKPNELNTGYSDVQTLHGHKHFVSSVCALSPFDGYPNGLIITGSNDKTICVYSVEASEPIFRLEGHTDTVCNLSPGVASGSFVSSSWDTTARLWSVKDRASFLTLSGHKAALWSSIQLSSGIIVTASADKTIRIYLPDGSFKSSLTGHKDCVRDLAAVTDTIFLSCSNDATIKQWNAATGECLDTLYGHPNFIYCLSILGDIIASSGEDRNVHIWHKGETQSLLLPSQSIWSVVCLPNGDIATGSSDGIVRVFSADPNRQADTATQALYDEEVKNIAVSSQQEIGGVKVADLPGPEVLTQPGNREGQNKMVRENGKVILYSWSAANNEWIKVGDVMGSNQEKDETVTPGKVKFNGQEYDYVFNVDIEDGQPPLKLPFNKNDDPWQSAQDFIHRNNLNQQFLEQVANFIISNAKESDVGPPSNSQEFVDPFTGGARYIPGGNSASNLNSASTDPFTGGNRYVPNSSTYNVPETKCAFFPQKSFLRFDQANLQVILEKLNEFNSKVSDESLRLDSSILEKVVNLGNANSVAPTESISALKHLYQWPEELLFPVLDITRLAVRSEDVNRKLCSGEMGTFLISVLNQKIHSRLPANQMLSLRTLSNMLQHLAGKELVLKNKDIILTNVNSLSISSASKPMQVAAVTILLNLAVVFKQCSSEIDLGNTLGVLIAMLSQISDPEATFRALVAVGTIVTDTPSLKSVAPTAKETISQISQKYSSGNEPALEKISKCSQALLNVL